MNAIRLPLPVQGEAGTFRSPDPAERIPSRRGMTGSSISAFVPSWREREAFAAKFVACCREQWLEVFRRAASCLLQHGHGATVTLDTNRTNESISLRISPSAGACRAPAGESAIRLSADKFSMRAMLHIVAQDHRESRLQGRFEIQDLTSTRLQTELAKCIDMILSHTRKVRETGRFKYARVLRRAPKGWESRGAGTGVPASRSRRSRCVGESCTITEPHEKKPQSAVSAFARIGG